MKKIFMFLIVIIVCLSINAVAQADKAYKKTEINIAACYGIVNFYKTFLDKVIDIPEYKVTSVGPFALLVEYALTNRFSVGLIGDYCRVNGKAEKYQLADQITSLSLVLRADYHFWTTPKIDPYFGGGIGINNSKYKNIDTHTIITNPNKKVPNTVDFSGQAGFKYFPLKHFGLCVEAGYIGGSFLQAGLTVRM